MAQVQLQLQIAQQQACELTDCILTYEPGLVFSTSLVRDYKLTQGKMSAHEQVQGYQNAQLYVIQLESSQLSDFLAYLKQELPRIAIQYRVIPILQSGCV